MQIDGDPAPHLKRLALVVVVLATTVAVSAILFKLAVVMFPGTRPNQRAAVALQLIGGNVSGLLRVSIGRDLNVFEIWSYLFPIPALGSLGERLLYGTAALVLAILMWVKYVTGGRRRSDLVTILGGIVFFLASLLPVVMASGTGDRQHLYAAPQAILILMLFWCLFGLGMGRGGTIILVGLMVVATAVSFPQKLVLPYVFSFEYATDAIKAATKVHEPFRLLVVKQQRVGSCAYEPCTGYFARGLGALNRVPTFYAKIARLQHRKLMAAVLLPGELKARITRFALAPGKIVVIDINAATARYRETHKL